MTDEEILELFRMRSEDAIQEVSQKYGAGCRKIAGNFLKDPADAEESINDAYLALWNRIPPENPHPLKTYLYRIVRNRSIACYHAKKARKRDSSYDLALSELEECLSAPEQVEDRMTAQELGQALNRFLGGLEKDKRVLFVRRYWYGDSVEGLAQQMGLRPNTVSARLTRLREKLRKELAKEGFFL